MSRRRIKQERDETIIPELPYEPSQAYVGPEFIFNTHEAEFVNPNDVKSYLKHVNIQVIRETNDKLELEFDLINVEAPVANALRRVLIAEVPTMAIEKVYLYQNTSCLPDEVLCHRLGLVPIKVDPRLFWFPTEKFVSIHESDEIEHEPSGNPRENAIFNLHVKCTKNKNAPADATDSNIKFDNHRALSGHFKWIALGTQEHLVPAPSVVFDDIVLAKLRPGQEIEAKCHCVKGIGKDHAKFSPVATASYRLLPGISLKRAVVDEEAVQLQDCFSHGVIGIKEKNGVKEAFVADARKDLCSRNVLRFENLADAVELTKKKNHFIFTVESTGAMTSYELVVEACRVLQDKSVNLQKLFQKELKKIGTAPVA